MRAAAHLPTVTQRQTQHIRLARIRTYCHKKKEESMQKRKKNRIVWEWIITREMVMMSRLICMRRMQSCAGRNMQG